MIPRRDPEMRPVLTAMQLIRHPRTDKYGIPRRIPKRLRDAPHRPIQTRNGLSVRPYRYRGTGRCMTEEEAERWLCEL